MLKICLDCGAVRKRAFTVVPEHDPAVRDEVLLSEYIEMEDFLFTRARRERFSAAGDRQICRCPPVWTPSEERRASA